MMQGARARWRSSAMLVSLLLALVISGAFADDASTGQSTAARTTGHLSATLPNVTLDVRVGADAPTASRTTVKRGHARTLLATAVAQTVLRDSWLCRSGRCVAPWSRRPVSLRTLRDRAPPARLTVT